MRSMWEWLARRSGRHIPVFGAWSKADSELRTPGSEYLAAQRACRHARVFGLGAERVAARGYRDVILDDSGSEEDRAAGGPGPDQ
jgi:hypothetical protein